MQTFLVLAEFLLIWIRADRVWTDSVGMDFRLLQTNFLVSMLQSGYSSDHSGHDYAVVMAISLTAVMIM